MVRLEVKCGLLISSRKPISVIILINFILFLAPHLKTKSLELSSFERMRVNPARSVLSRETASAIRYCVEYYPEIFNDDDLTTAFFLEATADWFNICNNRSFKLAFSKKKPEVHKEYVDWLKWYMEFYCSMKLSEKQGASLKPTQKGLIMATSSILILQESLLDSGFEFVLSARFTNDCIENFFR